MFVKLFPKNLNLGIYLPHPSSTYTCEVAIVIRVRSGYFNFLNGGFYFYSNEK